MMISKENFAIAIANTRNDLLGRAGTERYCFILDQIELALNEQPHADLEELLAELRQRRTDIRLGLAGMIEALKSMQGGAP